MDMDYLWDTSHFEPIPVRPPREDLRTEQVFYEAWSLLMEDSPLADMPNSALASIFRHYGYQLTQRSATVAASFICWLGSNMGAHFIDSANNLATKGMLPEEAFLLAWTLQNQRKGYVNNAYRTLELVLAEDRPVAPLDAEDYELAEHLASWLGSREGLIFLNACLATLGRPQLTV